MVRNVVGWARSNVSPVIAAEVANKLRQRDGLTRDDAGANARSILNALRIEAERQAARADLTARAAIDKDGERHTGQFIAGVRSQTQIDLSALLADGDLVDVISLRSEEANRLIRNLSQDIHDRIERETLGAIFEGRGNDQVAKALREIEGIGRQRARLIARDQASKLNAAMNEFRQGQAGVTHYTWKTVLDGRERPSHNANNGKVFAWASPPAKTGHPGHDVNCRCRAMAIITEDPDEIEKSAVPPEYEPGDLEDFFTANLPAIRAVAAVPRTNLGTYTAQEIAERLAQSIDLQRKISAAGSSILPEKTAEKLVVELFGYLPAEKDLAAMIPARLSKLFATRRSILLSASNERLQLIERILAQAKITKGAPPIAPAPPTGAGPAKATGPAQPATISPRQRAAVPKAAKDYPIGRYFAREVGPELPIEEAERIGEEFTRAQGLKSGHEWGLMHDDRGRILARVSSAKVSSVEWTPSQMPEFDAPDQRVTFHHNHPSSSSFSTQDFRALSGSRGLARLFAHGHDGSTYRADPLRRAELAKAADRMDAKAKLHLGLPVMRGEISPDDAFWISAHVRALALHQLGYIDYEARLSGKTADRIIKHAALIREVVSDLVKRW